LPAPWEFNLKAIRLIEKDERLYVCEPLIYELSKLVLESRVAFCRPVEWAKDLERNPCALPGGQEGRIAQPNLLLRTQASIGSKAAHDQGSGAIRQPIV
jgi:hypothetical protein